MSSLQVVRVEDGWIGSGPLVTGRSGMEIDKSAIPAVFMFQPTELEVLESDRLEEWERALAERVGLAPGPGVQRMQADPRGGARLAGD